MYLLTGRSEALKNPDLNETLRLILNRRSCRSFSPGDISDADIETILEAGRFAPSTVNLQTWSFIVFSKKQWADLFDRPIPFKGAYAVIMCADTYRLQDCFPDFRETPYVNLSFALFNAGLAAMNMTIAAEALGIKSVMLSETGKTGLLDHSYLSRMLDLPDGVLPVTTLVLGRPASTTAGIPPRQPKNAVVMPAGYNRAAGTNLEDWYDRMLVGYKLTHPLSSLDKQIGFYRKKMAEAEQGLQKQFLPGGSETTR